MGTIGEVHGEIAGISGGDFTLEGMLTDLHLLPSGLMAAFLPRKDFRGNGGSYFFGTNSSGTLTGQLALDRKVEEGFCRWCVLRPLSAVSIGALTLEGYGTGASSEHWKVDLTASGDLNVYTDNIYRLTSATDFPRSDTSYNVLEIWWRIDAAAGHVKVYKDFNYTTPVLDFVGDVFEDGGGGLADVDRVALTFGIRTGCDDFKVQDITLTYEKGYEYLTNGVAVGDIVDVRNSSGAVTATGTFTVTKSPPFPGDLTVGGVTLVNGVVARTSGSNDFNSNAGSVDLVAQDIADAINDAANDFANMATAVNSGAGVVTVTATTTGKGGNLVTLSSASADISSAGLASGADGVKLGEALVTAIVGNQIAGKLQLREVENASAVAWSGVITADPFSGGVYVEKPGATPPWSANLPFGGLDPDSGFPGEGFYYAARVPASTTTGDLTLTGAPTHHEAMDDGLAASADTAYVSNSTGGTLGDMYGFGTLLPVTGSVGSIKGITTYLRVRKDGVGVNSYAHTQDLGAGKLVSGIKVLPASFEVDTERMAFQPGTAGTPWDHAVASGTDFGLDILP